MTGNVEINVEIKPVNIHIHKSPLFTLGMFCMTIMFVGLSWDCKVVLLNTTKIASEFDKWKSTINIWFLILNIEKWTGINYLINQRSKARASVQLGLQCFCQEWLSVPIFAYQWVNFKILVKVLAMHQGLVTSLPYFVRSISFSSRKWLKVKLLDFFFHFLSIDTKLVSQALTPSNIFVC